MSQKVIAKVSDGEIKKIKQELKSMMEVRPNLSISSIRFGTLGDDNVISFDVDDDHYQLIIDKFIEFGINLLLPVSKQVHEKASGPESSSQAAKDDSSSNPKKTEKDNSLLAVETAVKNGDYETLIKISKDIRSGPELIKKAKDKIYDTVIAEIEKIYNLGQRSRIERGNCIERLIKISSDKDVKAMYKIDALKLAGFFAVKLCSLSNDFISHLVQLCNNNVVPNIVNVKSAIALSVLVNPGSYQSTEDLDYAVKYLNIKWLLIAYDIVIGELTPNERDQFIQLISAIKEKR